MNEEPRRKPLRRIMIGLDASSHSQAALEAAAALAADLRVELQGVFVEDTELLRAADVFFVREVVWLSTCASETDSDRIQRQMEAQAMRARLMLEEAATAAGARYRFVVKRGEVSNELLEAARGADLVLLGKSSLGGSTRKLGRTAEFLLSGSPTPVMVLRQGLHLGLPILALYDGSAGSETALRMAVDLALWRGTGQLFVLVWAGDAETQRDIQHRITERYGAVFEGLHFRPLSRLEPDVVADVAWDEEAGLVIVSIDSPLFRPAGLGPFLNEVDHPVLLVRPEEAGNDEVE